MPRSGIGLDECSGRAIVVDYGVRLDLDQPVRVDEARYLHDRVDRPDVAEELAMHAGDSLPVVDPREQDADAAAT